MGIIINMQRHIKLYDLIFLSVYVYHDSIAQFPKFWQQNYAQFSFQFMSLSFIKRDRDQRIIYFADIDSPSFSSQSI